MSSGTILTTIPPTHHFSKATATSLTLARLKPFQIKCKGNSDFEPPKQLSVSRRDAITSLTALSFAAIGISSPEIAEARINRAEMKRKIKQKLELLKKKSGLSRQTESDQGKSTNKDNILQLQPPPLPFPEPPLRIETSLVEATNDL